MSKQTVSGIEPGQRKLNGVQTTGRNYQNLSQPQFEVERYNDVAIPMRDGIKLLADIFRPATPGNYPVLIAASPYPRQVQDLGAPAGFIEAGMSDFFVPRGYVHVIVNLRGTGGSGGTFGFFDGQERQDMYDVVEWAAAQSWSDGNVGMLGISYFAMTQLEAAVEQPPHLKAIMPFAGTYDLYSSSYHNGLLSASFITPFLSMIGLTAKQTNKLWRSSLFSVAKKILQIPPIHKKFATMNGEAAMTGINLLLKLKHDPHPWDDLWRSISVEHPLRDEWWEERNIMPMLDKVKIPVYLGCDWENVPLHLPHTFPAFNKLKNSEHVRVAVLGKYGLTWPWESLHVEALAWFDQWLKGIDTGILEGPRIRYVLQGTDGWQESDTWPIANTNYQSYNLRSDGTLGKDEGNDSSRTMMTLGAGLNRVKASETDPPSILTWQSEPLTSALDIVGDVELQLEAISTASDTAWFAFLQDVRPDNSVTEITAGYLRAGLREVDETESREGFPVLPCNNFVPVPIGKKVNYRIPLIATAWRIKPGHCIRLFLTSDDQSKEVPVMMNFRHASVGTNCLSTIYSLSKLLLPVVPTVK